MKKKVDYYETLEVTITSATQASFKFPVEIGNISSLFITGIESFGSDRVPFSPNGKAVVDPAFFKAGFIKLVTRDKQVITTNIPLTTLDPTSNNGEIVDFQGLVIDSKSCEIIMGTNDITQLNKVFFLGFYLSNTKPVKK